MPIPELLRDLTSSAWVVTPIPSIIYHRDGSAIAINLSGRSYFRYTLDDLPLLQQHYNLYTDQDIVDAGLVALLKRSFDGKRQQIGPFEYTVLDAYARPTSRKVNIELTLMPLRVTGEHGDYMVIFYRDVGTEVSLQRELAEKQQILKEAEAAQMMLQEEIEARLAPVVPVYQGVLVLPLMGVIDSRRAQTVLESVLEQATFYQADTLILDITGVPVVDTQVANYLLHAMRALHLLGTETVLVGISPEIAQTIVQLGINLADITTRADLQSGLQYALARQGLIITKRASV